MPESPTVQTPESTSQPPQQRRSLNAVRSVLVLVFRLLLLGVGGSLAGVVGMAIATIYPAEVEAPPVSERVIQRIETLGRLRRSPAAPVQPIPSPSPTEPSPDVQSAPPRPQLTAQQRQQLQAELRQLKADLKSLGDRTTALENRVGDDADTESLEARLQAIEQYLDPQAASRPSAVLSPPDVGVVSSSTSQAGVLTVTLPSDALFQADQESLRPTAQAILDNVAAELQSYPGSTVVVKAHTDPQGGSASERSRAFGQAKSVQNYLTNQLQEGYHWIVMGYGSQNPLSPNDTPANRQRNRRIELTINPL